MSTPDRDELAALKAQLEEAQATLDAIRSGEVDAIIVDAGKANEVFTLQSADLPYLQLVEQMADGALSLDRDHTVLYCNGYFCDLVGGSREAMLGRSFMEMLDLDGQHAVAEAIERGDVARIRCELMRVDGERVPTELTISPPGVHSLRRATIIVTDRRDHVRLANVTLDRDTAKAESLAKDRFLATLGHELRSPLAALTNGVAVLRSGTLEQDELERVSLSMERQVRQLRALVDDLLDLTRVAQGKIVLKREEVLLGELLASAVETLGERRGSLSWTVEPPDLSVVADPTRLEQIVVNLISNAARYSDPASPISVSASADDDEVRIVVCDQGIGLSSEDFDRIFEPFVQVSSMSGGLGIGLTLVRQLVELHGGAIKAHSGGLGAGTTFEVALPAVDARKKRGARKREASPRDAPVSMLVVDDNVDAAEMLTMLLETDGHVVTTCHLGREAIDLAKRLRPEVVLLDLGLPDIPGYEVAHRIKADGLEDALIIAVTGFSHEDARRRVKEAGFDAHVVKPISLDTVRDLLAKHERFLDSAS